MNVLVDSSVWISYFRGSEHSGQLDFLIEENLVVINDLILVELVPSLRIKRQQKLISLLQMVQKTRLDIAWDDIIELQVKCIRSGINKVSIPDLIIAQNAIQNDLVLYSFDNHFDLISGCAPLSVLRNPA